MARHSLRSLIVAWAAFALPACGSSSNATPAPDGSAASDDAGTTPPDDAGAKFDAAPDDQDPNVYPAKHHPLPQVDTGGGPVLSTVKVVTVTFAGDAMRDELRTLGDTLPTTRWWASVGATYKLAKGSGGGYVELPDTVSGKTLDNDTDVAGLVTTNIQNGTFPAPDESTLYMLYFPQSTTITLQGDKSCDAFDGYHDVVTVTVKGASVDVPYAVMPRCDLGSKFASKFDLTVTASHELVEAATDPTLASYELTTNDAWTSGGGEVADLCQDEADAIEGTWHVSRSWDNVQAAQSHDPCVPATGLPYFGAAVDTETVTVQAQGGGSYQSDGYVTVARGASHDVRIDVFSDGPMTNDVTVVAGGYTSSSDPTDLGEILPGIVTTLSRTKAHNGQVVMMSITVPATTSPQDIAFAVRAINDSSDWHEWPVILRIK